MKLLPLWFLATVATLATGQKSDCSSGFKPGSQEHVTVRYHQKNSRGKAKTVVTEAEVTWKPQEMLGDLSCFDLGQTALLFKSENDADYATADVAMRSAGAASKWILDIKPCLVYKFAIKVTGENDDAVFELPHSLGPADPADIRDSGFAPDAPVDFVPEVGATMATLKWKSSDCAAVYYVSYREAGKEEEEPKFVNTEANTVLVKDLSPCTNYEVTVSAYLNEDAESSGDLLSNFATKPRLDAAKNLKVDVRTSLDSATITMEVWSVSCLNEYELTICESGNGKKCQPTAVVTKTTGLPTITHTASGLNPCTDYTLELQPLYPNAEVEGKTIDFRTLSPDSSTVKMGVVKAEAASSGSVMVSWPAVKCASTYKVYQKETSGDDWKQVADTAETTEITVGNVTPCTQYQFAITAEMDGRETDKSISSSVMSLLDEADPFEAPNLQIGNADRHADLVWDHAECIHSYKLKVCQSAYTDCKEHDVVSSNKEVSFRLEELEPCTTYTLEIIPVIPGKTFTAKSSDFTTTNGTPQAPNNFKVVLNGNGNKAKLSWDSVQCATGYKVYKKSDTDKETSTEVASKTELENGDNLSPCVTYHYSITSLVGEQESERSEWLSLLVPPQKEDPPLLKILNNENDNVTLRLDKPKINIRCNVDEYELSFSRDGSSFESRLVKKQGEEDVVLSFPGASSLHSIVQAKMRYADTDVWSEWASSREPGDLSKITLMRNGEGDGNGNLLVPIVVAGVLLVVVVALLVIFVIRKRRSRDRYDAEKAENGKQVLPEETQKLNEEA